LLAGGDEDVVMKYLRSLKLSGMVFFVTGVVYLVGWEQQTQTTDDVRAIAYLVTRHLSPPT